MIRVLRSGTSNWNKMASRWDHPWEDHGDVLLAAVNTDHFLVAVPAYDATGDYTIEVRSRNEIRLRLRTPIPLFDASHMGRLDAAKTAARAASNPTEELPDEREHPTNDPACCGG